MRHEPRWRWPDKGRRKLTSPNRSRAHASPTSIVIAGAGVAGSVIASGLDGREDVELICLEKVSAAGHSMREPASISAPTP